MPGSRRALPRCVTGRATLPQAPGAQRLVLPNARRGRGSPRAAPHARAHTHSPDALRRRFARPARGALLRRSGDIMSAIPAYKAVKEVQGELGHRVLKSSLSSIDQMKLEVAGQESVEKELAAQLIQAHMKDALRQKRSPSSRTPGGDAIERDCAPPHVRHEFVADARVDALVSWDVSRFGPTPPINLEPLSLGNESDALRCVGRIGGFALMRPLALVEKVQVVQGSQFIRLSPHSRLFREGDTTKDGMCVPSAMRARGISMTSGGATPVAPATPARACHRSTTIHAHCRAQVPRRCGSSRYHRSPEECRG